MEFEFIFKVIRINIEWVKIIFVMDLVRVYRKEFEIVIILWIYVCFVDEDLFIGIVWVI